MFFCFSLKIAFFFPVNFPYTTTTTEIFHVIIGTQETNIFRIFLLYIASLNNDDDDKDKEYEKIKIKFTGIEKKILVFFSQFPDRKKNQEKWPFHNHEIDVNLYKKVCMCVLNEINKTKQKKWSSFSVVNQKKIGSI